MFPSSNPIPNKQLVKATRKRINPMSNNTAKIDYRTVLLNAVEAWCNDHDGEAFVATVRTVHGNTVNSTSPTMYRYVIENDPTNVGAFADVFAIATEPVVNRTTSVLDDESADVIRNTYLDMVAPIVATITEGGDALSSAFATKVGDAIMATIRNTSTGSKTDHGRTGGTIENGATIVGPNGAKGTLVIADDGTWNVKLGKEVYSLSKGAAVAAGPKDDGTMPSLNGWKAWSYNSKTLATYR